MWFLKLVKCHFHFRFSLVQNCWNKSVFHTTYKCVYQNAGHVVYASCYSQTAQLVFFLNVMMHISKCVSAAGGVTHLIVSTHQVFAYDYCFWSMDESDKEKFAGVKIWCLTLLILWSPFERQWRLCTARQFLQCGCALCVCVCKQVRRWSSSALEKVFSTTPSRATMPVSLPTDKLVIYTKIAQCFLADMRD